MERAGKLITKLKAGDRISPDELARSAWQAAVGKTLASRAIPIGLVRDRLVVEVEDAIWQRQLFGLRHEILRSLRAVIGDSLINDIEFRIAVQRRPVQLAETARTTPSGKSADEADAIHDPGLRRVYKQARKKAGA